MENYKRSFHLLSFGAKIEEQNKNEYQNSLVDWTYETISYSLVSDAIVKISHENIYEFTKRFN